MDRRTFVVRTLLAGSAALTLGCRGRHVAEILRPDQTDMVGSHSAGAATFNPLIQEALGKLLGRHGHQFRQVSHSGEPPAPLRICFVGIENRSAEELADFRDQIYQQIDTRIIESRAFQPVSRRMVDVVLRKGQLRMDDLYDPQKRRLFAAAMESEGQPFDYLLYATLTSGTTASNKDYQRDYQLTMELVNIHTGQPDKEMALIRKGYHKTKLGKLRHYGLKLW